ERWIKGSAILGCVGCLVGHLFMFLVGGKTPDQSVHLNLTTTVFPAFWIGALSWAGIKVGGEVAGSLQKGAGKAQSAGEKGGEVASDVAGAAMTKGKSMMK
ncbi:hypothetical protein ACERJL_06175, partial [Klebsiella pneumoniae]